MEWRIPLADVDFDREEMEAVEAVLRSKWLTMGAVTQQFERDFSVFTRIEHCLAVSNCTAALHLAMIVLGVGIGDEVIVPSLSFVATANAVRYTGATAVFADIGDVEDLDISLESIESIITPRTKAIVVMHYGGYACDMQGIMTIAKERGLYVVEDAAHAVGSTLDGKSLGSWGDIGCFSFFPNKNMTTAEGGIAATNNEELAQKMRLLRSHGMTSLTWDRHEGHAWSYDVVELGYNYRIDEIRSALGVAQLKKLSKNNMIRRTLTEEYWRILGEEVPAVRLPFKKHRGESACHLMAVILPEGTDRTAVMERLKERGIQTSIHYPPIHQFSYYKRQAGNGGSLKVTEAVAKRELTLPLFPGMELGEVREVVDGLREALSKD
jgi:dTDP-4-amino-4,6-dideoxygalactose transaminase